MVEKKIKSIIHSNNFILKEGQFHFISAKNGEVFKKDSGDLGSRLKTSVKKRWPRLYEFLIDITSTIFFYGLSAEKSIKLAFGEENIEDKIIINLGSASSDFKKGIINVDICPLKNVQVIADAAKLPFRNQSIDMVICESLLEHAPYPEKVIEEIKRILKQDGYVYIEMPFIFPFHPSPNDYTRFTLEGLKKRFNDFEIIKAGARSGPMAALIIQIMYIFALLFSFGSEKLYGLLVNFFMVVLSPLKVLDFLFYPFPQAQESASHIYFFAKKIT